MIDKKNIIHKSNNNFYSDINKRKKSGSSSAIKYAMPPRPTFNDVMRVAEEETTPLSEFISLSEIIGKEEVVQGFWAQGEEKFKETLSVFNKIGLNQCIRYIEILNNKNIIGHIHISNDFARAPYSIARTLEFINNKEIEIEDLNIIVTKLRKEIGNIYIENGFTSWSLYYFLVAIKKIKNIGLKKYLSIISILKKIFGENIVCEAYLQGYLWFVESIEILSDVNYKQLNSILLKYRDEFNESYLVNSYSHNPRSFARFIKLKSDSLDKTISFHFNENLFTGDEVTSLISELLNNYFSEADFKDLAPSELTAFVFDAIIKSQEGEDNNKIALFLKHKYFSDLARRKVYSVLRGIGPEIEIQQDLPTYDVDAAHMVAFFFLVESSGDGLIEFPLGPANYHGSLTEIIRNMGKIRLGDEYLIPQDKIIPLDVSISVPPNIIHKNSFKKKATFLRVVNDFLYTAEVRLGSAFHGYPMDESGVKYKTGIARTVQAKGFDIVENRSGNLITKHNEESVVEPLVAHEQSFKFFQLMYSTLLTTYKEEPEICGFEVNFKKIYESFESQVLKILSDYNVEYIINIDNNKDNAFSEISFVRKKYPIIYEKLKHTVNDHLNKIDKEVQLFFLKRRVQNLKSEGSDAYKNILIEIESQKLIDLEYGNLLEALHKELINSH